MNNVSNLSRNGNSARRSHASVDLSYVESKLIISSLQNEIRHFDQYFNNLDLEYTDFFRLQANLAELDATSADALQIEYEFIDAQISEWDRKLESWRYVRWHLQDLLAKLRLHLRKGYQNAA